MDRESVRIALREKELLDGIGLDDLIQALSKNHTDRGKWPVVFSRICVFSLFLG